MGSIYKITNTVNGKSYIGKTTRDAVKTRIRDHLRGKGSQPVKDAIEKYGQDAFTYEILHDGIIPEFLDDLEKEVIAKFNTVAPHGYNLTEGGDGGSYCEETRRKISEAHKGKKLSEEHRRKISEAHTGEKHHFFGKSHLEESKQKMSEAHKGHVPWNKGKPLSEEHSRKHAEVHKGRKHSEESKQKMSEAHKGHIPWNKGKKGKPLSEEARRKISESLKGRAFSEEHRRNLSEAAKGRKHSEEARRKMSETHTGEKHNNYGKPLSEETRRKISEARETPERTAARDLFFSLPPDMALKEKRRLLRQKITGVHGRTIHRWVYEWTKVSEVHRLSEI